MPRIVIPVTAIEFDTEGNTLWVQSEHGGTVMRIKFMPALGSGAAITTDMCESSPVSHADLIVRDRLKFCLANDVLKN